MGSRIGSMNFTVKITCYGSSLLRHVTVEEKRDSHINILLKNLTIENEADSKVDDTKCKQSRSSPPLHIILPANGTEKQAKKTKNESSQTRNQRIRKKKRTSKHTLVEREEFVIEYDNTFCPPPLFLNLKPDDKYYQGNDDDDNNNSNTMKLSQFLTETKFEEYDELSEDEEPLTERLIPVTGQRSVFQIESDHENAFCHKPKEQEPSNLVDKKLSSVGNLKNTMPIPVSYTHLTLPTICSV